MHEFDSSKASKHEYQSVSNVGKHYTENKEIEDTHYERRVKAPVNGIRIHSTHPLEIACESRVLEQYRRHLLALRLTYLVCAFKSIKECVYRFLSSARYPSVDDRNVVGRG